MGMPPKCPTLDKIKANKEYTRAIRDFLEEMEQYGYRLAEVLPKRDSSDDAWIIINDTMDDFHKGKKVYVILDPDEWAAFENKINISHPKGIAAEILKFFHLLTQKGVWVARDRVVQFGMVTNVDTDEVMAAQFGVNLNEAEKERRALLKWTQEFK